MLNRTLKKLGTPLAGTGAGGVPDIETLPKTVPITDSQHPVYIVDVGNLNTMTRQTWVDRNIAIKIFDDDPFRRGFVIMNNGLWSVYIGTIDNVTLLQKVGFIIRPQAQFSSALYQGRLYIVADTSAGATGACDIRVWEELL